MRRSKFLIVVYARQAAAEGRRAADELGEASRGIGMSGSTIQQVSSVRLIARLAALWIVLLVLPFAERTLLAAKTYYFLYIGLGLVFVLYGLTIRSLFLFLVRHKTRPGLRLDCVSGVVHFYLQHSVIRSSSPHARAISPTSN
jgi:hypothetical protein